MLMMAAATGFGPDERAPTPVVETAVIDEFNVRFFLFAPSSCLSWCSLSILFLSRAAPSPSPPPSSPPPSPDMMKEEKKKFKFDLKVNSFPHNYLCRRRPVLSL